MSEPDRIASVVDELIELVRPVLLGERYEAESLITELSLREEGLRLAGEEELATHVATVRDRLAADETGELLPAVFALQDLLDATLPDPLAEVEEHDLVDTRLELDLASERTGFLELDRRTRLAVREAATAGTAPYLVQLDGVAADDPDYIPILEREITTIKAQAFPELARTILLVVSETDPADTVQDLVSGMAPAGHGPAVATRRLDPATLTREPGIAREWYAHLPPMSVTPDAAAIERALFYLDQISRQSGLHPVLIGELREALGSVACIELKAVLEQLRPSLERLAEESRKRVRISIAGLAPPIGVEAAGTLREVLWELVANAVVHGIESPDERVAEGKPSTGRIDIAIGFNEDRCIVHIRDDGRGVEEELVRTAVRNPAHGLSRAKRLLSTMLDGTINIRSGERGTTVRVTVAALEGLLRAVRFARGGCDYVVPAAQVVAIEQWQDQRVTRDVAGNRYFRYETRPVPIRELRPLVPPEEGQAAIGPGTKPAYLAILELAGGSVALPADETPSEELVVRVSAGSMRPVAGERQELLVPEIGALFG